MLNVLRGCLTEALVLLGSILLGPGLCFLGFFKNSELGWILTLSSIASLAAAMALSAWARSRRDDT